MLRAGAVAAASVAVSSCTPRRCRCATSQQHRDRSAASGGAAPQAAVTTAAAATVMTARVREGLTRLRCAAAPGLSCRVRRHGDARSSAALLLLQGSARCVSMDLGQQRSRSSTTPSGDSGSVGASVAAAEEELRRVQDDVGAVAATPVSSSHDTRGAGEDASTEMVRSSTSTAAATNAEVPGQEPGGGGGDNGGGVEVAEPEWPEPTLSDLDRSIPQVDCEFVASLIRSRNLRRDEFLSRKERVKQRVEELTKKTTATVSEAVKLPAVGGLDLGWFNRLRGSDEAGGGGGGGEDGLVATSAEAPVVASAAVLEQLSAEEKDLLLTSRPEYDDGFVLLDCRTVNEVTSWGIIEGAKVLPAHELFEAFHATPAEFLQDYGFAKPRPDDIIICYCQYGPRSLMAAQILSWMGYLKVMHFRDGYYEWGKQYNLLLRRWMEHDRDSGNELRRLATFRAGLELQREIAPEFNALPMQEARQYLRDTTRSSGTLLVGEGLRLEAYNMVATLTEGLAPPSLPGVVDDGAGVSLAGEDGATHSRSTRTRRLGEQQLTRFLEQTTGLDAKKELGRPALSMSMGDAQAVVLDSLAYGHELGASPDTATSPMSPPPRRN
ncbi:Rhodanese-like domain containing protein [Novymonas esmeraldas]|uniref:Rhodanese-like domain containing protein n=1 Tax=Novymonas esmeraldas TaxID=1808958 RepID=A0AAW0F7B9_9TRYP